MNQAETHFKNLENKRASLVEVRLPRVITKIKQQMDIALSEDYDGLNIKIPYRTTRNTIECSEKLVNQIAEEFTGYFEEEGYRIVFIGPQDRPRHGTLQIFLYWNNHYWPETYVCDINIGEQI